MYIKKILSVIIMVTMLMTAYVIPVKADEKVTIKVDGEASDWTGIEAAVSNESNAHVKSLKIVNGEKALYFCIEGDTILMDPCYGLFINIDNEDSTGFQSGDWEESGFDFYIENGYFYKYAGDGFDWEWEGLDSVRFEVSDSAMEIAVPKDKIGVLNAGSTITVAYNSNDELWNPSEFIPAKGSAAAKVILNNTDMVSEEPESQDPDPVKVTMKVDGNASEWSGFEPMASNTANTYIKSLKVINGEKALYFCIEGNTVRKDPSYDLLLNTDNDDSTGFQSKDWSKSGFDFLIENGQFYKYTGNGTDWNGAWEKLVLPEVASSESVMEIAVPKDVIGALDAGSIIGVAYYSTDANWVPSEFIPSKGSDAPKVTLNNTDMVSEEPESQDPDPVPEPEPIVFDDADQIPDWAKEAVDALSARGIILGFNNKFYPYANVSRAQFATQLVRAADILEQSAEVSFADVTRDDWFYVYVASAAREGIITDNSGGSFAPYAPITRQDMAVMLSKSLTEVYGKTPDDGSAINIFTDRSDIADYAKVGVATTVKYGLMEGVENSKFMPEATVTRAQAAKIIYMLLKDYIQTPPLTADSEGIYHKELKPWNRVSNYVCYYSKFKPELTYFDVAIVEARQMTREDVQKLRDSGTYVIAYVTVGERDGELEKGNGKGPGGYASYYIDDGKGNPAQNPVWKSYYINAGDPDWQNEILNNFAKEAIEDKGCDGVFLDTVDTAELYPETADGMVELIKKLHEKYPDKKIVNNRGMFVLPEVAQYISGLMYESFSHDYDFNNNKPVILSEDDLRYTGHIAVTKINEYRKENNFRVFCLDYADPNDRVELQKIYNRAWEYDFIPYASNIYLDQVYIYNITPKSQRGVKKFIGEASKPLDPASTDARNLALASNGTIAATDSNFSDYSPKALNDGYRFEENMFWADVAWASSEKPQDHWAQFTFDKEKEVKEIMIYWAEGDSMYMTPKQLNVQIWAEDTWVNVKELTNLAANTEVTVIELDEPIKTKQIRILQPVGMGAEERPDLMWVYEVEMYSLSDTTTCTITYDANGGSDVAAVNVTSGSAIEAPSTPTKEGYTFAGWYKDRALETAWNFATDKVTSNITLYAKWTVKVKTEPSQEPAPTPTPTPTPVPETKVEDGRVTMTIPIKPTTDANGKAVAEISGTQLANAIAKAAEEAAKQDKKTETSIIIEVTAPADAKAAGVSLTDEALKKFVESKADTLTIATPFGTMTFDEKTAEGILKQSAGTITITATKVEATELTAKILEKVGDGPVVSFDITGKDKAISQLGGKVTVTIPYVLKAGENPNSIVS